jgi:hypothetical protein
MPLLVCAEYYIFIRSAFSQINIRYLESVQHNCCTAKHWIQSVILGIEMFIKGFVWLGAVYNNLER